MCAGESGWQEEASVCGGGLLSLCPPPPEILLFLRAYLTPTAMRGTPGGGGFCSPEAGRAQDPPCSSQPGLCLWEVPDGGARWRPAFWPELRPEERGRSVREGPAEGGDPRVGGSSGRAGKEESPIGFSLAIQRPMYHMGETCSLWEYSLSGCMLSGL